eukprot:TRINITY_DN523_c0_g1_i1.p1 TRINITY_DN523_c0_g1~~TRINITY_DN523_c0_g1_i1.p1  ORF type:complete len:660 (+),score=166.41 TRINITY_DN523_c0_g1_i1:80-2059(+)
MGKEHTELSTMDYRFILMGYAIGIGNIWRFPYLVGKFGGGAFLVAYLVSLVLVACPMYFLELSWGNYTRKSTMDCIRIIHPRWIGIGWMTCFMLIMVLSYYNMLLAYSSVYLVNSFKDPLPWTSDAKSPNELPEGTSASENFWWNDILVRYDPDDVTNGNFSFLGPLQGHLAAALFVVWAIVFVSLYRGISASAKVSYVTVLLPVVLMLAMLFRAVGLEGAGDGLHFYLGKFDSSRLTDLEMWATACGQILFSLSPGMGTAITISSHSRRNEDIYTTNLFVTICNSSFSVVGGIAVFSILGYMANKSCTTPGLECKTVSELASTGGAGLAFVTLAEGVGLFGVTSNFFATMFFIMLLTLGLDSTFAWVETVVVYSEDYLEHIGRPQPRPLVVGVICMFFFLIGLPYCTRLGFPLLDIVDHYVSSYCLIIACFFETLMLRFDWGWERVLYSIKKATIDYPEFDGEGREISRYWKYTLMFTVGPLCFGMFMFLFVKDLKRSYESYPTGLQAYGWSLLGIAFMFIPYGFLTNMSKTPPTFEEEHDTPLLSSPMDVEPATKFLPQPEKENHVGYQPPVVVPFAQPLPREQPDERKIGSYANDDYTAPYVEQFPSPPPVAAFPTPPVQQLVPGYTIDEAACPLGAVKKENPLSTGMGGGVFLDD